MATHPSPRPGGERLPRPTQTGGGPAVSLGAGRGRVATTGRPEAGRRPGGDKAPTGGVSGRSPGRMVPSPDDSSTLVGGSGVRVESWVRSDPSPPTDLAE